MRTKVVEVKFEDEELAVLDERRAGVPRARFLREAGLGTQPHVEQVVNVVVPEINRDAWTSLARASANLNQIARRLNFSDVDALEIATTLSEFRARLIGE